MIGENHQCTYCVTGAFPERKICPHIHLKLFPKIPLAITHCQRERPGRDGLEQDARQDVRGKVPVAPGVDLAGAGGELPVRCRLVRLTYAKAPGPIGYFLCSGWPWA